MKALLLGAENEIGQWFQKGAASRLIECVPVEGRRVDLGSARRIGRLMRRHRPDIVINTVDYLPRADDDESRRLLQQIVRDGAHNIAKAAHGRDTPLIHLSTDAIFLGAGGGARTEQDPPSPVDDYGRAHLEAETRILEDVPSALILRSGWVFSEHPEGRLARLLALLPEASRLANPAELQFAPTAAVDVARVLLAIVQQISCGIAPWGIYHYCAADIIGWMQFLERVHGNAVPAADPAAACAAAVGSGLPPFPCRAGVQLNCQKLLHHFGVRQRAWGEELKNVLAELGASGADVPGTPADATLSVGGQAAIAADGKG